MLFEKKDYQLKMLRRSHQASTMARKSQMSSGAFSRVYKGGIRGVFQTTGTTVNN